MNDPSYFSIATDERSLGSRMRSETGLREVFVKLWRRKAVIIGTVLASTLLPAIILSLVTPKYTATASIAMERRGMNIANWDHVASGLPGDESTFASEIELLRSRDLAEKVMRRLKLDRNPEFKAKMRPKKQWLSKMLDIVGFSDTAKDGTLSKKAGLADSQVATLDAFLKKLKVIPIGLASRVMEVSFTSKDAETAALVPNTLAEMYIESQLQTKFEAVRKANELLNEHVTVLRRKVEESENAVEEFREESGLLKGKEVTLTAQQTAELNSQLVLAKTAQAEAEARLRQVRELIDSSGGAESAAQVLDSRLIQRLREQEAEIERRAAQLSIEHGPLHPVMIKLQAERHDLQGMIKAELDKIIQGYENEVNVARARQSSLETGLQELRKQVGHANTAEVKLRMLEREAKANQMMLASFLARFRETSSQQDLGIFEPDAKIISHADVPVKPSSPKTKVIIPLAFVGSLFIGVLLAFVVDNLDQGLRSGADIESVMGVPLLAQVPALTGFARSRKTPQSYILAHSSSALGESFRTLHAGIRLSNGERPLKTILVTSAQPEEGKTSVVVCLARIQSLAGSDVVVVDADFRRPSIDRAFGGAREPGLADVLARDATLGQVIQKDEASGACFIPAGKPTPNPPGLLGSEEMARTLNELAKTFEFVIVDSPPLMAVSDARLLSKVMDATVLVVRWANTRRDVVNLGLKQISSSGGRLAGVVLSRIDVKKHARYGYPDSGIYLGALKKYYVG